jgi:hypothetical protein
MNKEILHISAARNPLILGMGLVARAVVTTLAPGGRYAIPENAGLKSGPS